MKVHCDDRADGGKMAGLADVGNLTYPISVMQQIVFKNPYQEFIHILMMLIELKWQNKP